jgi:hypothetical protein
MQPPAPVAPSLRSPDSKDLRSPGPLSARTLPLLEFMRCVVEDKQAIYISAPVTTGPRYLRWLRRTPDSVDRGAEFEKEVVAPNRARGRELAHRVRERFPGAVVINPTAVLLPGWQRGEYHELWGEVVQRYARMAVFGDGWEYSYGCLYEFLTACRAGVESVDERYEPIPVGIGVERIHRALAELQDAGLDLAYLRDLLAVLTPLCDRQATA